MDGLDKAYEGLKTEEDPDPSTDLTKSVQDLQNDLDMLTDITYAQNVENIKALYEQVGKTTYYEIYMTGSSTFFNGQQMQPVQYISNPLISDNFYYSNFKPVMVSTAENLWFVKTPNYVKDVTFDVQDPYYSKALNMPTQKVAMIQMSFSTRDPKCESLFIQPLSYLQGLGRIGQYLAFLTLIQLGLLYFHKQWFEKELFTEELSKQKKLDIPQDDKKSIEMV